MPSGTVTWNPSDKNANVTLSGSDLVATSNSTGSRWGVRATFARSSGKYYFEVSVVGRISGIGLRNAAASLTLLVGDSTNDYGFYFNSTSYNKRHSGVAAGSDSASYSPPIVFMVAVDLDAGKIWFGYNGTWAGSGNPATAANPAYTGVADTFYPGWSGSTTDNPSSGTARFKTSAFTYAAPSGFSPWEDAPTSASIAATLAGIAPSLTAEVTTGAAIAATLAPTTDSETVVVTTGAAIDTTLAPVSAAIVASGSVVEASIAGTLGRISPSLAASVTTGAAIAATLRGIRCAINKNAAPSAFVRRRLGILLYEPLPLRTSGALGNFADEFVLAHRFGDLTSGRFKLGRLSDTEWFAADHVMSLSQLFADGQHFDSWEQRIRSDGAGHTWTVAELASPAPPGAEISATGTGKRDDRTGALIENPADINTYILRLAGRDDRWWDELRAESSEAGLRLAGSVDQVLPIAKWIDSVCESAGAIWCPGMARLYPAPVSGYVGDLHRSYVKNLVVRAAIENTGDVLRLYYDPDKAAGRNQHFIELIANPQRLGGFVVNESFDWLRSPHNAESVGRRRLPYLSGIRWDLTFDCEDMSVKAGQWRRLVAHPQWPFAGPDPVMMILEAKARPNSGTQRVDAQALTSSPAARVTGHSVALPSTRDAGVEQIVQGGKLTYVVRDASDRPVKDALVALDRGPAKKTNQAGEVVFTEFKRSDPPVEHKLAIQKPGARATEQSVWL